MRKIFFLNLLLFVSVSYGYSLEKKASQITLPLCTVDSVLYEAIDSMIQVERNCPSFTQDKIFYIHCYANDNIPYHLIFASYKSKYTLFTSDCIGYFYYCNQLFLIAKDSGINNYILKKDKNKSQVFTYFKYEGKDAIMILIEPTIQWDYKISNKKLIFQSKFNADCM